MGSAPVTVATIDSAIGPLTAGVTDSGLALLEFSDPARLDRQLATLHRLFGPTRLGRHPMLDQITTELGEYFEGTRRLCGYGGGLARKKFLLDLERRGSTPLAGTPLGNGEA